MNIIRDDERDARDDDVQAGLRAVYAAPAAESYWAMLERRIMARVTAEGRREWWSYFPAWSRVGLAAAALALLVASAAAWQTQRAQERVAVQEVLDIPSELPILETSRAEPNARRREATLRFLISQ
jgi:hypothetical protein